MKAGHVLQKTFHSDEKAAATNRIHINDLKGKK